MLHNKSDTYDRRYVIDTHNGLNEKIEVNVFTHKREVYANVQLEHDGEKSYAVVSVPAKDLILLGESIKRFEDKIKKEFK